MSGKTIAIVFGVGVVLLLLWNGFSSNPSNRGVSPLHGSGNPYSNEIAGLPNVPVVPNATYARDFQTGARIGEFIKGVFGWGKKPMTEDSYDTDYVNSLPYDY